MQATCLSTGVPLVLSIMSDSTQKESITRQRITGSPILVSGWQAGARVALPSTILGYVGLIGELVA